LVIWFFNYRYALLFLFPVWMLAAKGVETVGQKLGGGAGTWGWYACVLLLMLPRVASYYQDGSRKDLRAAAAAVSGLGDPDKPIVYASMPTTLRYYFPEARIYDWEGDKGLIPTTCYLVLSSNGWDAPVQIKGRTIELVASIGRRRFDGQSYLIRVYRVGPTGADNVAADR
jgi:hypothetical protein